MKYGISLRQIPKQVYKRVIIPGLAPSQIMATVTLGMSRPQWLKFIVSARSYNKLDMENPFERYKLLFDEKFGFLFQAFLWKRQSYESNTNSSGFGMGFNQMLDSGSLSILSSGMTADRLCTEIVNNMMEKLNKQEIEKCVKEFRNCFNPKPSYKKCFERLDSLKIKSEKEKKIGLLSSFVWAIDESLTSNFESPEKKARAFTVPRLFLDIIEDIVATDSSKFSGPIQILCSEKPGELATELNNVEIAALIHELLQSEQSRTVVISFIVFDLIRSNYPTNNTHDIDRILREAKINLPDDSDILEYLKKIYNRIFTLLSKFVNPNQIMSYSEFLQICGPEQLQKFAVLWEYNLIAGELEEMLRLFIFEKTSPPYQFSFRERWDSMFNEKAEYWSETIERFDELASSVVNNEVYLSAFWINSKYLLNLPSWFEIVFSEFNEKEDIFGKFYVLLKMGGILGDAISFDGETVTVIKKPATTYPLIARGAFYEWLRTFVDLWR